MDKYLEVAIAAAKEAGRIQKVHLADLHKVEFKGEINPVSEVDKLCEKAIAKSSLMLFQIMISSPRRAPSKGGVLHLSGSLTPSTERQTIFIGSHFSASPSPWR